jgi:serine protease AprX
MPEPRVMPAATVPAGAGAGVAPHLAAPIAGLPTVAVFDTGTAAAAADLRPWIVGTKTYVLPPDNVIGSAAASVGRALCLYGLAR